MVDQQKEKPMIFTSNQSLALKVTAPELSDYLSKEGCVFGQSDKKGQPEYVIEKVARLNLCVGPNNSGKSRFLRALAKAGTPTVIKVSDIVLIRSRWKEALNQAEAADVGDCEIHDKNRVKSAVVSLRKACDLFPGTYQWRTHELPRFLGNAERGQENRVPTDRRDENSERIEQSLNKCNNIINKLTKTIREIVAALSRDIEIFQKRVYIPTLRTMRRLQLSFHSDIDNYINNSYSFGLSEQSSLELFTGATVYRDLKDMQMDGDAGEEILVKFQRFVGDMCFGGRNVKVKAKGDGDKGYVEIRVGTDPARHLDQLGDGIAQAVILSFPFFRDPKRLFLVEEPETHLHPGMQRAILRLYSSCKDSMVFVTTHSNHLVDMAAEEMEQCSILRFRKNGTAGVEGERFEVSDVNPGDLNVLWDLGVHLSSVARVNAVIWVEGITDRLYLRKFIELMQDGPMLLEHLHFGFLEYAGSSITHYSFANRPPEDRISALRIGGTAIVVADSDGEEKYWRDDRLRDELADRYVLTRGREIENMLPVSAIRTVLIHYGEEESVVDSFLSSREDYKELSLGAWLEEKLTGRRKREGSYAGKGGTVSDKMKFCRLALSALESRDQLDPEVCIWVSSILVHIRKINGFSNT